MALWPGKSRACQSSAEIFTDFARQTKKNSESPAVAETGKFGFYVDNAGEVYITEGGQPVTPEEAAGVLLEPIFSV